MLPCLCVAPFSVSSLLCILDLVSLCPDPQKRAFVPLQSKATLLKSAEPPGPPTGHGREENA